MDDDAGEGRSAAADELGQKQNTRRLRRRRRVVGRCRCGTYADKRGVRVKDVNAGREIALGVRSGGVSFKRVVRESAWENMFEGRREERVFPGGCGC